MPNRLVGNKRVLRFGDLRSDWYRSASTMARFFRAHLHGKQVHCTGFPRQWIPFFEWWAVTWADAIDPACHIPVISDISEQQLVAIVEASKSAGTLRQFVEMISTGDPLLADVLFVVDSSAQMSTHTLRAERDELRHAGTHGIDRPLRLTSWQSYGRTSMRELERLCLADRQSEKVAVLLPCSRRRPYSKSRLHRRIAERLHGIVEPPFDRIVISSLGVIPEPMWEHDLVVAYDSGVPDIYRVLQLMRSFFEGRSYTRVIDCISFEPYRDLVQCLVREGLLPATERVDPGGRSPYWIRKRPTCARATETC